MTDNNGVVESPPLYEVSGNAASLTGYVASTATPKTTTTKNKKNKKAGTETARNYYYYYYFVCDVIMSATSAWSTDLVCSARAPFEVPKERKK